MKVMEEVGMNEKNFNITTDVISHARKERRINGINCFTRYLLNNWREYTEKSFKSIHKRRWTTKWNSMSQSRLPQQSSPTQPSSMFCAPSQSCTRELCFFIHCVIFRRVTKEKSHFNPKQLRSEIYHCVENMKKI